MLDNLLNNSTWSLNPNSYDEQYRISNAIIENIPIGIEIYDSNGILKNINGRSLTIYGIDNRESVIGKVSLMSNPYMTQNLKDTIESGKEVKTQIEYDFDVIKHHNLFETSRSGSIILEIRLFALRNNENGIICYIIISDDITGVIKDNFILNASNKNLEMVLKIGKIASWIYDDSTKVYHSLQGDALSKGGMTYDNMLKILHPDDHEITNKTIKGVLDGSIKEANLTIRFFLKEDNQYHYYESYFKLIDNSPYRKLIIGTQLDVTEKVLILEKLNNTIVKQNLAIQISNIIQWDFDVESRIFKSYNEPIINFDPDKEISPERYMALIHPDDRPLTDSVFKRMYKGEYFKESKNIMMRYGDDEEWQYFHITLQPLTVDTKGKVLSYTGYRQNITELHTLNQKISDNNRRMTLAIKTTGMSYWDYDVNTKSFYSFNDKVNDYDSTVPLKMEDYIAVSHPDDVGEVIRYITQMDLRVDSELHLKYRCKTKYDKVWQTMLITSSPSERDKNGNINRYIGLKYNNTEWEDIVLKLREMKDKAELSDKLKSAFLANMSHEIRTPLNAIIGFSELMKDAVDEGEKEEYFNIISANNDLLLHLINDILDLSKIESGIVTSIREYFNLNILSQEIYATMFQRVAKKDNVEFIIDTPSQDCEVFLDKNRLKQVWINYISNAIKCTQKGYIKMGYEVLENGLKIYVEDTGIGIPKENHNKVFTRFQKLNDFAQGTGLGLSICKAIIENAGGKVGFESESGVGSTFWAYIPCKISNGYNKVADCQDEELKEERVIKMLSDKGDLKILVAEDNDSNYLLIQHILKGYTLTRAINGIEAINMVKVNTFDVILMDSSMPIMNGIEATKEIRLFNQSVPIIALTANSFDSDVSDAMASGCDAFLSKPTKRFDLLNTLYKVLDK